MAINFTTLFTNLGKMFFAGNTTQTAFQTTIEDEVEDAAQQLGTVAIELETVRDGILTALRAGQATAAMIQTGTVQTPSQRLLIEMIKADNPQVSSSLSVSISELIKQMDTASESLDASAPSTSVAFGGSNVGNGTIVTSVIRGDGKKNEHILAEDIEGKITTAPTTGLATFTVTGEASTSLLNYDWPKGSGVSTAITSNTAASATNLITNGDFETEETNATDLPSGWVASVGTLGTTLKLTDVEVQTVTISGTPTGGHYLLHWVDGSSKTQTTGPLAYNASQADVQTALQALTGLGSVTVVTSGTSPNSAHTVTFTGVPGPAQMTSTDNMTGGVPAIAHATTTAGSGNVVRGARAVEFDSDGAQLTTIQRKLVVSSKTPYAFCLWIKADVVPIAGVITVDLIDGVGGSVISDDASTANSFTISIPGITTAFAAKTAVFRLPTNLPDNVYVRIRITTAISAGTSVFIDEVSLVPMTKLYAGGVYMSAFTGPTLWSIDDIATITVSNDRAGAMHEWCNRVFGLATLEELLPTNSAGAETQSDALIA